MKNILSRIVPAFLCLIASVSVYARQIEGKVLDPTGEPVIGATVMEQGTTNGTVTDYDGVFHLDIADGKMLVISYVGYKSQTVAVSPKTSVYNIRLEEDSEVLEDVIVIGYGTQKRSDVTGSISSVSTEEIRDFSAKSLAESLSGLASCVTVTKGS
jgi:hypothetical protein